MRTESTGALAFRVDFDSVEELRAVERSSLAVGGLLLPSTGPVPADTLLALTLCVAAGPEVAVAARVVAALPGALALQLEGNPAELVRALLAPGTTTVLIGRSGVGKSSLVNMLVGMNKLARVSGTPGKTRNVEHFRVDPDKGERGSPWLLADLPGYGFAKTSQTERAAWRTMIDSYLLNRENLQCVFVLIDVRLEPQSNDLGMIRASKAGFLFRTTDKIRADNPDIPAYETFDELAAAIAAAEEKR